MKEFNVLVVDDEDELAKVWKSEDCMWRARKMG